MGIIYHSLVLLATFAIFSCGITESRNVGPPSRPPPNAIVNLILQSQGSSIQRIHELLVNANGNLEQAVTSINSELNDDILTIDGETLKINADGLQRIITSSLQTIVQSKFPQNPALAASLQSTILEKLSEQSSQLISIIEQHAVPVDVAEQWLQSDRLNRTKRSLQPRDFDLATIISDLVGGVLQDQLVNMVVSLLETVKTLIQGFYVETSTGDAVGDFVSNLVNWVVKGALQVITLVEDALTNGSTTTTDTTSRRRREVDVALAASGETAASGEKTGSGENSSAGDEGLDVILRPIITIVAVITTPINLIVVNVGNTVLNLLQPVVGTILITPVRALLVAIVNLLLPTL